MTAIASKELVFAGWALIFVYMAVILFFVIRGALKIKNMSDYTIGSIAFNPYFVGLSLAASTTSAATFIINPGFIALYGISGLLSFGLIFPIAVIISLFIFTKGFRKYGNTVQASTIAQWVGSRYESPGYSLFFGFLSIFLLAFIVLICVGLTKVLSKTLNVNELYILIGLVVFIFGYMMFGGANSMVYTNTIQALIMLVVAVILLTSGREHFSNGISGFIDKLGAIDPNLTKIPSPESYLFRDYFEIIFCQIFAGIAVICQPHIITKSLLLKSNKDVNKYLFSGITAQSIFFLVVITGLYARLRFPDLTVDGTKLKMDGIISAYVVKEFSVYVGLIVVMGLLSAGLSTLETLIQSISATITSDIVKPLWEKYQLKRNINKELPLMSVNRIVIVLLGAAAIFVSYEQLINPRLSVAILAQNFVYAYFAAAIVPVFFGTFLKNVPKIAPISASITAVSVHFFLYYIIYDIGRISDYFRNPAIPSTIAILCALTVGTIAIFIVKKEAKD